MKFIIIKKRTLLTSFCLFVIIFITFSFVFKPSIHFAVPLNYNCAVSDDFFNKINSLTNSQEKIAYLTFDDGPNNSITPKVLDILKDENVKATFFVIGKYVEENPEIVKRAYEEGHYIANHGYSHDNSVLYKNSDSFIDEIKKTDLAIGKAIGINDYCSHVFRFPNGFIAPIYKQKKKEAVLLLSKMNYTYIDWNCLNNDSMKKYSPAQLLNNLKKSCKNKNSLVILMHDTKDVSNSSLALKDSILYLKSEGYEFKNFYEFIN